ncbi:DUF4124 domain-containing protein [Photobacterium minamisatsumaniensis]|uniref:DUF4124 domain-containing protein n=1 Tax=Photobacterium minamisatsumaniensis TaxID=2910233 RepID=UPI003D130D7F
MKCLYLLSLVTVWTASFTVQAEPIYTWEDEDGKIHFSDQPQTGATELILKVPKVQTPPPQMPLPTLDQETTTDSPEPALPAATIKLLTPTHQQTLRNNEGKISVRAHASRKLNQGHTIQLLLDGKPYGKPQTQQQWQLSNLDRGSHTLQSQLLKYGKVIASSETVTVFLHRATVKHQKAPAPMPK